MAGPTAKKPAATLRLAETKDAPRIAAVIIAAMELSPHWTWRFPYRKQYPDVHQRETERRIVDYIKKSKDGACAAVVAELEVEVEVEIDSEEPSVDGILAGKPIGKGRKQKQKRQEIVGIAIAQLPGNHIEPLPRIVKSAGAIEDKKEPVTKAPYRQDAHEARTNAFVAELGPAKKRYFDGPYGNNQMHLDFMAVDPAFHRRGIALQLMHWILEIAGKTPDAEVVTLFATPMGSGLYRKAGFEEIGTVSVKLEGDTEEQAEGFVTPVMVWKRENGVKN